MSSTASPDSSELVSQSGGAKLNGHDLLVAWPIGNQISIVSAFGRGHWLAVRLAREGMKVTLIDLTSKLGVWPPEDAEGPFGFFRHERLSELQIERIFSEDPFEEVDKGFTLWLSEGPLEMKSALTPFYFEKNHWPPAYYDLLTPSTASGLAKNSSVYKSLAPQKFHQQWIIHLAHQWAASTYSPSAKAAKSGNAISLLSSFYVRRATRTGHDKSLNWLRENSVEVFTQAEIKDLSFGPGKSITGLELVGEKQGYFKQDQLVWMLSSEETFFYDEKLGKYFFPAGALEPEWCWVRFRVRLADGPERNCLPLHLVLLGDIYSPWTHENMTVLQRTALDDQFDVWIRLPNVQRFNKEYLTLRGQGLCELLREKINSSDPSIQSYPQEYYYTYSQLGASRFPIFSPKKAGQRGKLNYKNLSLDGPELWGQYTWDASLGNQQSIADKILSWWNLKVQKVQKQQAKENHP